MQDFGLGHIYPVAMASALKGVDLGFPVAQLSWEKWEDVKQATAGKMTPSELKAVLEVVLGAVPDHIAPCRQDEKNIFHVVVTFI